MLKVASLHYGVIFKKAFSKPHIFAGFVKDLTGIQLEIDTVETEKAFDPPIGKVNSQFDLFAEDKKNRIIVDIQYKRYPDHYHRFLHYHCAALLELAGSYKEYRSNIRVLTIVVLTAGDQHKRDVALIDFDPKDLQGNKLGEIPHQVIYLCPGYVSDKTPEQYREWLYAICDTLNEEVDETQYTNPTIQEVLHTIQRDLVSPQERARMFDEYGDEQIKHNKFAEGKAEGIQQTALAMLRKGMDINLIQEVTGLSLEVLQQLQDV
ncbi:hypothetical protein TI04_02545 [Achromatium sp. WMS2]|nr:hypothetical protein TI04_02545 [Achromatium sp. WMS2]